MTDERTVQAQMEMAEAQFQKDASSIEDLGRQTFGAEPFDGAVAALAEKLGPDHTRAFTQVASQFDSPHEIVMKLADDEQRLAAMRQMPPTKFVTEIARIQAELRPREATRRTTPTGGSEAEWRKLHNSPNRILSDADWGGGLADQLSEDQWQRNWEKRQRDRAAKSPQRLGSRVRG
jgi:hypothetical protein